MEQAAGLPTTPQSYHERSNGLNDELLTMAEREMLGWPGVNMETAKGGQGQGGFWASLVTVYRFGRRQLGHIHHTGVADLTFSRESHVELSSDGRVKPHGAGFASAVSYHIRESEDVPGVVELFRMDHERAKVSAERSRKT